MKILLDPNFIINKDDIKSAVRFDEIFSFSKKYLTEKFYLTSELLENIICLLNPQRKMPKQLHELKVLNLYALLGHIETENLSLNNSYKELKSLKFSCIENIEFQQNFINYCSYLENNNEEVLLFLSDKNLQEKKQSNSFYFVFDIYKDLDSSIGKLISEGNPIINRNAIKKPELHNPLPNRELCKEYKQVCEEHKKGLSDKKPLYITVCKEVAFRNGYEKNDKITKKIEQIIILDAFSVLKRKKKFIYLLMLKMVGLKYVIKMEYGKVLVLILEK